MMPIVESIKSIVKKLISLLAGTLDWGLQFMRKLPLLVYLVIVVLSVLVLYLLVPTYITLTVTFAVIFALVVLLPLVIEYRRRLEKGPGTPRVFPETTVIEEKPEIPPPPKGARPETVKKFLFAERPKRAEKIGRMVRVVGDVTIPSGAKVREDVVVQGFLRIRNNCHFYGSIKADRGLEIGEKTVIDGNAISGLDAVIGPSATIKGILDAGGDAILHEKTSFGSVAAEKNIKIGPDVSVKGRIQAGESIISLKLPKPKLPFELPKIAKLPPIAPPVAREPAVLRDLLILDDLFARGEIDLKEYVNRRSRLVATAPEAIPAPSPMERLEEIAERLERVVEERVPKKVAVLKAPTIPKIKEEREEAREEVRKEEREVVVEERARVPEVEEFIAAISDTYHELSAPTVFGLRKRYVEISKIRDGVCKKFEITKEDFNDLLSRAIQTHPGLIELTGAPYTTMRERPTEVFEHEDRHYFYLQLKGKGEVRAD